MPNILGIHFDEEIQPDLEETATTSTNFNDSGSGSGSDESIKCINIFLCITILYFIKLTFGNQNHLEPCRFHQHFLATLKLV